MTIIRQVFKIGWGLIIQNFVSDKKGFKFNFVYNREPLKKSSMGDIWSLFLIPVTTLFVDEVKAF